MKGIDNRIAWVKEEAEAIKSGEIYSEEYTTGDKASSLSRLKIAFIPFSKMYLKIEQILYIDIPIKSEYTNFLYIALPFSRIGMATHDHPVQLSCVMKSRIPSFILWKKEGFVAAQGKEDPLYQKLVGDKAFNELTNAAILWEHEPVLGNSELKMKLKWALAITPLNKEEIICAIHTGTEAKGVFKSKRIYDLKLRLALLQQIMRNISELNYAGENKPIAGLSDLIHELKRRQIKLSRDDNTLLRLPTATKPEEKLNICQKCGAKVAADKKFCENCGTEIKKVKEMLCKACGAAIFPQQKFCGSCGAKIEEVEMQETKTICPKCGFNLKIEDKICEKCGYKLGG